MKKVIFFLIVINVFTLFSQEERIPEGWDKIILEGEIAYMNLINGEVSKTLPRSAARPPQKVKEYEPTIFHYVKKGDTFSKIARQHNISLSRLYRLNSLEDFDTLEVGQEIVIGYKDQNASENGFSNSETTTINTSIDTEYYSDQNYHTVQPRETLYRISVNYGISVGELKRLNSLKSNLIIVGQKLKVQ